MLQSIDRLCALVGEKLYVKWFKKMTQMKPSESFIDLSASREKGAKLVPHMTNFQAVTFLLSSIVGSGIFSTPGIVYYRCGNSVPLTLLMWLTGGFLAYCGAISYAEFASRFPNSR